MQELRIHFSTQTRPNNNCQFSKLVHIISDKYSLSMTPIIYDNNCNRIMHTKFKLQGWCMFPGLLKQLQLFIGESNEEAWLAVRPFSMVKGNKWSINRTLVYSWEYLTYICIVSFPSQVKVYILIISIEIVKNIWYGSSTK